MLSFAGRLRFHLTYMYDSWPYKVIRLAVLLGEGSRDQAHCLAHELFEAKDCCLDRGISMRVRDHVQDRGAVDEVLLIDR